MSEIIRKIMSRKLWLAIAGIATGIAMVLGVDATEIETIAGGVVSMISCVLYIIVEGKIDAERVKNAVEGGQIIVDTIIEEPKHVGFIQDGDNE